jgi:predicted permease
MESLERAFLPILANAYREYGIVGLIVCFLAVIAIILFLRASRAAWERRHDIKARLALKIKENPRITQLCLGFLFLTAFAFLFLPSSPLVACPMVAGAIGLLFKGARIWLRDRNFLVRYCLALLFCLGLTAGGMLHDLAFPPTALCLDGTYSSSAHRRGTCSWHGGVREWNPPTWWQSPFE